MGFYGDARVLCFLTLKISSVFLPIKYFSIFYFNLQFETGCWKNKNGMHPII